MTGNFSFVSRLSLHRNRATQRCLARNSVNVHRTCSLLLTRLRRTVNEPQPKMIKINYCSAWCEVDGSPRRCVRVYGVLIRLLVARHNFRLGETRKFISLASEPFSTLFPCMSQKISSSCDVTARHTPPQSSPAKSPFVDVALALFRHVPQETQFSIMYERHSSAWRLPSTANGREEANERPDSCSP